MPDVEADRVLTAFDDEMRRRPPVELGVSVEEERGVVRVVGEHNCILYANREGSDADEIVVEQTAHFRRIGAEVEWKVYGHDRPRDLGERLRRAGYLPDPPETLMVWDLETPLPPPTPSEPIEVRQVRSVPELEVAVKVSEQAFGPGHSWGSTDWTRRLRDPSFAAFVAFRAGVPAGSGRLWLPPDRSFASIWGGGTIPAERGHGVFRTLVSVRGELARKSGYRYLTVDALETSRPILQRLGFVSLVPVQGWVLKPG